MPRRRNHLYGLTRLDLLLAIGLLAIIAALVTPLWRVTLSVLDVANWPRGAWFVANIAVLLVLLAVWQGPALFARRPKKATSRTAKPQAQDKQKELAEQRKLFERMQQARKRQII